MRTITNKSTRIDPSSLESFANEKGSELEIQFARLWNTLAGEIPMPQREFKFNDQRGWRFDFAWPSQKLALEIEGDTRGRAVICHACGARVRSVGTAGKLGRELRLGGRHTRATGFQSDCDKYNTATALGWSILRFTSEDLTSRPIQSIELVQSLLLTRSSIACA